MDNLIPIGVSILSACLKKAGHQVKLFDTTFYNSRQNTGDEVRTKTLQVLPTDLSVFGIKFKQNDMIEDFRHLVDDFGPDLIGCSCVEPTIDIGLKLLNSVREKKIPKIMGGVAIQFLAEKVIKNESIDMICMGEGEDAIVELADAIVSKKDYSQILNLWVKKGNEIIKNEMRPLKDVNTLPFQDWSIYEVERFWKPMGGKVRVTGAFEFTRGCPRSCTYCSNYGVNLLYKGKYVRRKNIQRVIDEIKYAMSNYQIGYVYFYAENFLLTLDDKGFDEFINLYKEINLPFWIETEPASVNITKALKLKDIGCEGISIGVEHGNEEFRKNVLNRRISNLKMIEIFSICKSNGIRVSSNNIIGFPTETRELIFDTINLNRELQPNNIIVNLFSPYHGMKLREVAIEKGFITDNSFVGDYRTQSMLDQPQLTKDELLGLHRTFVLYVRFPKERWSEIEIAEKLDNKGNQMYENLSKEYREMKNNF